MTTFRRAVLWLAVPLNLFLVGWIAIGRALFGIVTAWAGFLVIAVAGPPMLACLLVSTVLLFCPRPRPVRLTAVQAWLQGVCWVGMFVMGIAVVDADDAGHVGGIVLSLFGDSGTTQYLSAMLFLSSALTAAVAWLALVVVLIAALAKPRPAAYAPHGHWHEAAAGS